MDRPNHSLCTIARLTPGRQQALVHLLEAPQTAPVPEMTATDVDAAHLIQAQRYLIYRQYGLPPDQDLEADWNAFYDLYSRRITKFACRCGAAQEDIADCIQEVWAELLLRLLTFRLDRRRGQFDSWLFHIVRAKTVDLRRSHKRRSRQEHSETPNSAIDDDPGPARTAEDGEWFTLVREQLKKSLSDCNFQVLQMRLIENRPVAEVAEKLGLSHEQVWYRYHRARHEAEQIGSAWLRRQQVPQQPRPDRLHEKNGKTKKSAQGKSASSVSLNVGSSSRARQGGNCVDYVFQKLELGRRELSPEWKVEWNCEDEPPRPMLYIRKSAMVAFAEICGPADFITTHWPRIVNAAIAAGVAAGIATIIATPTAALPVFQADFHKLLQGKGGGAVDERVQVALSAKQEANGPWGMCKD